MDLQNWKPGEFAALRDYPEIFCNKFEPLNICAPYLCQALCVCGEISEKMSVVDIVLMGLVIRCSFKPGRTACQISTLYYHLAF